jgi:predicted Zn-dependent protease
LKVRERRLVFKDEKGEVLMMYSHDNTVDYIENLAYLFSGITRGITHLEEDTYIQSAFFPTGMKHGYQLNKNTIASDQDFIARWPEDKFPLRVYMSPDFGYLFNPIELKLLNQIVQNALTRIQAVNPDCFQFNIVTDRHMADIVIKFRRTDGALLGHCVPELGREKQITSADININIPKNITGENITHPRVLIDVLHNLLHALGIYGHSENPLDSSYKDWNAQQQLLTPRDIKTLLLLYRCPLAMQKKDLMLLWADYQSKNLMLPMNGTLDAIISKICNDELQDLPNTILARPAGLSVRELALQESFNRYIQRIKTA